MRIGLPSVAMIISGLLFVAFFTMQGPFGAAVLAETAEEAGVRITTKHRDSERGFVNYEASLTMVLKNKRGQKSNREMRFKVIEVDGEGNRSLFVFDRPQDVKGTAFMVHSHRTKPDDQWLYLPALKRVKRISSANQSGSFVGSEFSYEDLGSLEVEKYRHKYLRDESCGNTSCHVVEMTPKNKKSGYSRQLIWFDKKLFRIMQVQYFDKKNEHLKTMVQENHKKYTGNQWRASKVTMQNHLTGKSTVLNWSDFKFGTDLDLKDFTKNALKRVR
ncbi:MAG: outer membrane lipoprotein-sorting protein [Roseovarius sp.]|nr:outer membrane lipoprotein-sorting protein [Roseovarius sp.]